MEDPVTSFVKIRTEVSVYPLIISECNTNIYFFNKQLEIKDSVYCSGPVVDIDFIKKWNAACNIGILNPNNGSLERAVYKYRCARKNA
jgi:hypothetical protein